MNVIERILANMPKLNKLDISETLLPRECFKFSSDIFEKPNQLIKLKANYTNFDLSFFSASTGSLHEVQLEGCRGITASNIRDFFLRVGKASTSVFDVFKFL